MKDYIRRKRSGIVEEDVTAGAASTCKRLNFGQPRGCIKNAAPKLTYSMLTDAQPRLSHSLIVTFICGRHLFSQVVSVLSLFVLLDQARDDFLSFVELAKAILERGFALVGLEESVSLPEGVVLCDYTLEEGGDAGVVGKHETGYTVRGCNIG
jgi:hypothetical protein